MVVLLEVEGSIWKRHLAFSGERGLWGNPTGIQINTGLITTFPPDLESKFAGSKV